MKAKSMNTIARSINANRCTFKSIVADFQAVWAKVFPAEAKALYNEVCERLKEDKANDQLKGLRYSLELVFAKCKSLNLTKEEKELVTELHNEDGLLFTCLTMDYICQNLPNQYISEDGLPMEEKKNKETGLKEWRVVEKWTVLKVGRYFRLANVWAKVNAEQK